MTFTYRDIFTRVIGNFHSLGLPICKSPIQSHSIESDPIDCQYYRRSRLRGVAEQHRGVRKQREFVAVHHSGQRNLTGPPSNTNSALAKYKGLFCTNQ